MSDTDRPGDGDDPVLRGPLAEIFAEGADDAGFDRLIEAARSGRVEGLTDDERAILADFERERAAWDDAGLTVDLGSGPEAPGLVPTPPAPRGGRGSTWWWAGAFAAAAVALIFALWPRPPDPVGLRAKGAFDLHVTVVRSGGLAAVESGARLETGDRIGLAVSTETPGHLYVYAVGDDGPARLHPAPGGSTAIAAGDVIPLPAGAALTPVAAPTCEYIVGIFATEPLDAEVIERALRDGYRADEATRCEWGPVELPGATIEAIGIRR